MEFESLIKDAGKHLLKSKGNVRIISHLDCDGMCASALLIKTLNLLERTYSLTIVPQLDVATIRRLGNEKPTFVIFSDLGSEQAPIIEQELPGIPIIILDHHRPKKSSGSKNIVHVNPHILNDRDDISGSGVVYYFTKNLRPEIKKYSHIPVIGAIGDNQARNGFRGYNKLLLKEAITSGNMIVSQGLRLFGAQTKPLHKVLECSVDTYIPGVTGSATGALDFVKSLGIDPKSGKAWKKLIHLTEDELQRLTDGILKRRSKESKPSDIFGEVYTIKNEEEGPFKDAREYSTLLNACGRLNNASVGIGSLLGNPELKKQAVRILSEYRRELLNALNSFNKAKTVKSDYYMIVNAKSEIRATMIGTIASIVSRANHMKPGTVFITMARSADNMTKISARKTYGGMDLDLRKMMADIIKRSGGESGGHRNAAGALIKTSDENFFIKNAKEVLEKYSITEIV